MAGSRPRTGLIQRLYSSRHSESNVQMHFGHSLVLSKIKQMASIYETQGKYFTIQNGEEV